MQCLSDPFRRTLKTLKILIHKCQNEEHLDIKLHERLR